MFVGFPDEIHKEKPLFLDFENNWLWTDGPTDGSTDRPSYRDARTHLKTHCSFKIFFSLEIGRLGILWEFDLLVLESSILGKNGNKFKWKRLLSQ